MQAYASEAIDVAHYRPHHPSPRERARKDAVIKSETVQFCIAMKALI